MSKNGIPNGTAGPGIVEAEEKQSDRATLLDKQRSSDYPNISKTLISEFGQKSKLKRRSSFTLPRSWSLWRLRSVDYPPETSAKSLVPSEEPRVRGSDNELRVSESSKLRRKSSFKSLMERFRGYKSADSRHKHGKVVQYVEENPGKIVVPVLGLQNHGNSCYINAVVQCLNNTAQVYEFFISGRYKRELHRRNKDNAKKFGTNGELTEACGEIVQSLGRATYNPDISNALIQTVAKFWPEFHDGVEQDAQEFLLWFLDKIHEDLNKRRKKKLKVKKSNKPDDFLAATTEEACGSSFITRLYHHLFRSSITCRHCGQQSNTFDPFMCLSVPLPQIDIRPLFINLVFFDYQSRITKYGFCTSLDCSVKDVKELVAQKTHIRPDELLLLELNGEGYQKTLYEHGSDVLQELDDLYALELPKARNSDERDQLLFVVVLHVAVGDNTLRRISAPRVIQVSRETTYADFESSILGNLEPGGSGFVVPQFRIHLVERNEYLNPQVDHPLYTEVVDDCLSLSPSSPKHLKVYVEWDVAQADMVMQLLIHEKCSDDASVQAVKSLPETATKASLSDCLDLLMQEETVRMDGGEQWECPNCGALQSVISKRGSLWTLPEILVINLKRFRQTSSTRFKLTSMVDFPLSNLDMSRYLTKNEDLDHNVMRHRNGYSKNAWLPWQKPRKPPDSQVHDSHSYSLFGVVNHHGRLNSGHYTAFCRHPADGAWYLYDDLKVKTIENPDDVVTKDAYMLFYQREPLNTFPGLYYNDFSHTSQSMYDIRSPTPRASKSNENLPEALIDEDQREQENDFTRTAQIYASLPRHPRRSLVHHPASRPPSSVPAPPSMTNGFAKIVSSEEPAEAPEFLGPEYFYQRHPASSTLPLASSRVPLRDVNHHNGAAISATNGDFHPDEMRSAKDLSRPQLTRYKLPIQESCV